MNGERNKAILTVEQDARYSQLMELAYGLGMDDTQADEDAWQGLCEEWPELAKFDGAQAGFAE